MIFNSCKKKIPAESWSC